MTPEELLKLLRGGGRIVSSNDLSSYEIGQARACQRFYVDPDGFGFAYFPPLLASGEDSATAQMDAERISLWAVCKGVIFDPVYFFTREEALKLDSAAREVPAIRLVSGEILLCSPPLTILRSADDLVRSQALQKLTPAEINALGL